MSEKVRDIDALAGERWFPLETSIVDDMKNLWGDWGVCSEVDTLRDVIMRQAKKLKTLIGRQHVLRLQSTRRSSESSMTDWLRFTKTMA